MESEHQEARCLRDKRRLAVVLFCLIFDIHAWNRGLAKGEGMNEPLIGLEAGSSQRDWDASLDRARVYLSLACITLCLSACARLQL